MIDTVRRCFIVLLSGCLLGSAALRGQVPLDANAVAIRSHQALVALDRYLETWNSRNPLLWASSLHFPHVRPGPGAFELSRTPEEYAAGVNYQQTLSTGWHHSEWVSREVLHVGLHKVHVSGAWQRYTADDRPLVGSLITYIVTNQSGRWGVQSRFAAGASGLDAQGAARNAAAGLDAVRAYFLVWNSHDPKALGAAVHFPHVRIADGQVDVWNSVEDFLAGSEPGRQYTWYQTRLDQLKVVQTSLNGVNVTAQFSRMARDGRVLARDEGLFLVVLRDSGWKVQARSTMGTS